MPDAPKRTSARWPAIPDELQGAVPAGRRQPAVLDGADEPARRRRHGRLHRHRRLVAEGGQGSEEGRRRSTSPRSTEAENFTRVPRQDELKLTPGAAYVHYHLEQHDLRHRVARAHAGGGRRAARLRRVVGHLQPARSTSAKYGVIYAGAQKNLGPSGVTLVIIREDLLGARRRRRCRRCSNYSMHAENDSLYNTPPFRHLHPGPGAEVAAVARAAWPAMADVERAQGGEALRRDRPHRLLPRHAREKDSRSRMNVTFRLPTEDLEKQFVKEVDRGRFRRPQGPPLGRRHARLDLQRLPRGGRRRARGVHAGVRSAERVKRAIDGPRASSICPLASCICEPASWTCERASRACPRASWTCQRASCICERASCICERASWTCERASCICEGASCICERASWTCERAS